MNEIFPINCDNCILLKLKGAFVRNFKFLLGVTKYGFILLNFYPELKGINFKFTVDFFYCLLYNSFVAVTGKIQDRNIFFDMCADRRCATAYREPCQAGNRAALSVICGVMQLVCSYAYPKICAVFTVCLVFLSCFCSLYFLKGT